MLWTTLVLLSVVPKSPCNSIPQNKRVAFKLLLCRAAGNAAVAMYDAVDTAGDALAMPIAMPLAMSVVKLMAVPLAMPVTFDLVP